MALRKIRQLVPALEVDEGAGVTVHRSLGTPHLRSLDPFLMLDHFESDDPDDYIAGFPEHPHRGFVTLTYMLDGRMLHQDSMGNRGELKAGGVQWMKAASGVIHSEMPQQAEGLMRGFQLWINLPASEKMSNPEYQEFPAARIPSVEGGGARVKVIGGAFGGARGPIRDPHTDIQYLDVTLAPGSRFTHRLDAALNAFLYLFEGAAEIAATHVSIRRLVVLAAGDELEVTAPPAGARFLLIAGRPLNEPVVQHGPFVMNTEEEIRQAFEDFRNGRLVQQKASTAEV